MKRDSFVVAELQQQQPTNKLLLRSGLQRCNALLCSEENHDELKSHKTGKISGTERRAKLHSDLADDFAQRGKFTSQLIFDGSIFPSPSVS
jgi:hypothetical protein